MDVIELEPEESDQSPAATLKRTIARWAGRFSASCQCNAESKVVAPLMTTMGLDYAVKLFDILFKERLQSSLPSYLAIAEQVMLFGALQDSIHFGPEANMVSSLRAQYHGAMDVLAVSQADAFKLIGDVWGKDKTWEKYNNIFSLITEMDSKVLLEKGIKVWHTLLEAGDVMYLPAGFTVATRMRAPGSGKTHGNSDGNSAALKFLFVPSEDMATHADVFSELVKCKPPAAEAKVLSTLADAIALALNPA